MLWCGSVCWVSIAVTPLSRRFRASKLLSAIFVIAALTVSLIIILEASTGGTIHVQGTWSPFLIFPLASALALFEGMIEVTRRVHFPTVFFSINELKCRGQHIECPLQLCKLIPPLIVSGDDDKELSRINATVHLSLGLSGTVGALIAFPLIEALSYVYAMAYVPVFLGLAALLIFLINHKMPERSQESKQLKYSKNKFLFAILQIVGGIVAYFKTIAQGAVEIVNRKYWFLLVTFTLPQIAYFWVEMLLLPVYADRILLDGALVGILLASVDFGEFCGAVILLIFGSKVPTILLWTRLYGVFLNIYWLFPFVVMENPIEFVFAVMPLLLVHNACFSTNDVSMLSFIQSSFPEDTKNPENDKLSKAIGFLYTAFVVSAATSTVGIAISVLIMCCF